MSCIFVLIIHYNRVGQLYPRKLALMRQLLAELDALTFSLRLLQLSAMKKSSSTLQKGKSLASFCSTSRVLMLSTQLLLLSKLYWSYVVVFLHPNGTSFHQPFKLQYGPVSIDYGVASPYTKRGLAIYPTFLWNFKKRTR